MGILIFIAGLIVGAVIGMMLFALVAAGGKDDENG